MAVVNEYSDSLEIFYLIQSQVQSPAACLGLGEWSVQSTTRRAVLAEGIQRN
jgi:hypothetical protein